MLLTENDQHTAVKTTSPRLQLLVLCTGNSARSIMAEALFNSVGANLFRAYSAGSRPTGIVNPMALEQINHLALGKAMIFRSKSWLEFSGPNAPELDLVLSVCDNAAAEICPTFCGDYQRIHWSLPDPAGSSTNPVEERDAFKRCFNDIKSRVESLVSQHMITNTLVNNSLVTNETVYNAMRIFS